MKNKRPSSEKKHSEQAAGARQTPRKRTGMQKATIFLALLLALLMIIGTLAPLAAVFGESGEKLLNAEVLEILHEDGDRQTVLLKLNSGIFSGLMLETTFDPKKAEKDASPLQQGDKVLLSIQEERNKGISESHIVGKGEVANATSFTEIKGKVLELLEENNATQMVKVEMNSEVYKNLTVIVPFERKTESGELLPSLRVGDSVTLHVETDKYGAVANAYVSNAKKKNNVVRLYGVVKAVTGEKIDANSKTHTQLVRVVYQSEEYRGLTGDAQFERNAYFNENYLLDELKPGDQVVLQVEKDASGSITKAYVADIKKQHLLTWLVILFFICLILVGGMKGVKAIISLVITAVMVFFVFIPLILKGYNPVLLSILVCVFVVAASFLIISGFHRKTLAATVGTVFGIVIAGILFLIFTWMMKISGITTEQARMLLFIPQKIHIDFKGLLFAGVLIASMGASMDIGMTISSTVNEVGINSPGMNRFALFKAGLNVGRDAMATMTNTLILAYVGTSLNLVLLLSANSIKPIVYLNWEILALEITRALTATIGLISAIPITAFVAAELFDKNSK